MTDFGGRQPLISGGAAVGTQSLKGSIRWSAPELLALTDKVRAHVFYTKPSDVWAFGVVIYVSCITILLVLD